MFKCFATNCGEKLQKIGTNPNATFWLDDKEGVSLYVCTSRDCKNMGVVVAIPHEAKED